MRVVIHRVKKLRCEINESCDLVNDGKCVGIWIASNGRLAPVSTTNDIHCVAGVNDVLKVELVLAPELGVSATLDPNGGCVGAVDVLIDCFLRVREKNRTLLCLVKYLVTHPSCRIVLVLHIDSLNICVQVIINCSI